ncbi:Uncharacterized protein APZ42_027832 [Daphnia magna]|uniref:Uncharacterized protein n=1 Tax=Daphnia magna TaxID=35525 RepID=A0A0P6ADR4_9CRUS|nr:Uncharacterized protein APZ42_027832 [Daphnia magna]
MTGFGAGMVKYQFVIFSFSFHRFVCGNNLLNDITRCECSSCNMLISPDVTKKKNNTWTIRREPYTQRPLFLCSE